MRRWAFRWSLLFGLWALLSAQLSVVDLVVGGVVSALVASVPFPPGEHPALAFSYSPTAWRRGSRAWLHVVSDWPRLIRNLVSGKGGSLHRLSPGSSEAAVGPYLSSVGPAQVAVGMNDEGELVVHVFQRR